MALKENGFDVLIPRTFAQGAQMFRNTCFGLVLCLAANVSFAGAPATFPIEAFFANYKVSSVQVSPDGKYLAVVVSDKASGEGNKFLTVLGADDRKIKTSFQVSENQVIWHYWWA